jgi:hypothetical protein
MWRTDEEEQISPRVWLVLRHITIHHVQRIRIGLERPCCSPRLALFLRARSGHSPKAREKLGFSNPTPERQESTSIMSWPCDGRLTAIGTDMRTISYVAQKNAKSLKIGVYSRPTT